MTRKFRLNRRSFLRGSVGGVLTSLALPPLEAMMDANGESFAQGGAFPTHLGLWFWGDRWLFVGWGLLRQDFRNFRTDRIVCLTITEERYGKRRAVLEREWRQSWSHDRREHESEG